VASTINGDHSLRPWHALAAEQALQHCGVDPQHGLEAAQVDQRRDMHSPNALPEAPPRPLWRTFARQFSSPLIYILFAAAMIAVGLGHYGDAGVILAVVIVNALIGSFQEGRAERSMASLRRLAAPPGGAACPGAARRARGPDRSPRADARRHPAAGGR
jgi:Ca2+-transporting ATPase